MATLLDHYLSHLISAGLVRSPAVAGPLPPAWRNPLQGVPAPGEGTGSQVGATAVVGLMHAGGLTAAPLEGEWRRDIVDVVIRTTTAPAAVALGAEIRRVTIDRWNWAMGAITVMESLEFRPLQPLLPSTQYFTFITGFVFQIRAEDAA
jgi:hypothetical protein